MAFTQYDNPGVYSVLNGSDDCGCGSEQHPPVETVGCKECSCCPPGTIEQHDADGKVIACLTPNDTLGFMLDSYKCPDGCVKLIVGGQFLGCITIADYLTLNPPA